MSEFATDGMVSAKNIKVRPFYMVSKLVFLSYVAVYMLRGVFTSKSLANHSSSVMNIVCRMFAVTCWCVGLYSVSDTYRHTKISTSIPFGHLLVVVRCCSYRWFPNVN